VKDASTSRFPLAAFSIPPSPPGAVAELKARFEKIGDEWARTRGELDDAKQAVTEARAADLRAAADAVAEGRKVVDPAGAREEDRGIEPCHG
jgi:hypothetical protein